MSSIATREPLSWLVMILKLDWLMIGCVFLMNFQKCDQLSLSSLPNNMANPSANIGPFAVVEYTEYSVCFPKLMWAASACKTSCRKGTCFFDVDGEMKIPIKKLSGNHLLIPMHHIGRFCSPSSNYPHIQLFLVLSCFGCLPSSCPFPPSRLLH